MAERFLFPEEDAHEMLNATLTLDTLKRVKARYGVSVKLLIMCCKHYGIIDEGRAASLFKQHTARKWNQKEPVSVKKETTRFFPSVLRRMRDDGIDIGMQKMTVDRILASSRCNGDRGHEGITSIHDIKDATLREV